MILKENVEINKSYQRIKGKDVITDPKTVKAIVIPIPQFLADEIQDYINRLYHDKKDTRIFAMTSHGYIMKWIESKEAGVSVLEFMIYVIVMYLCLLNGISALAIADRVGLIVLILLIYAHLFPTRTK